MNSNSEQYNENYTLEKQQTIEKSSSWKERDKASKKAKRKKLLKKLIYVGVIIAILLIIEIISLILYPGEYHNVDPNKQELMDLFKENGYTVSDYHHFWEDSDLGVSRDVMYFGRLKEDSPNVDKSWVISPELFGAASYDYGSLNFYDFELEENALSGYKNAINKLKKEIENYTEQEEAGHNKNLHIIRNDEILNNNVVYENVNVFLRINKNIIVMTVKHLKNSQYDSVAQNILTELYENSTFKFRTRGLRYTLNDDKQSYSVRLKKSVFGINTNKNVIIPSTHRGLPVTNINYGNIYGLKQSAERIIIPDSVTSIAPDSFLYCYSLKYIKIPDSVTSIGYAAFHSCTLLKYINISDSVTSIGDAAFYNCTSLTSIAIPDSVTSIGNSAFYNCASLPIVTIPNSVTSIGNSAFDGCSNLERITVAEENKNYCSYDGILYDKPVTEIIYIPYKISGDIIISEGVTSISNDAFSGRSSLIRITIPDTVTSIGDSAFHSCDSLASVTIPNSVTSIGGSVFYNCDSLSSVTIPNSVTSIGDSVFYNCDSLSSVTIPNSVTSIGDSAFYSCDSLTSLTIPESVTSIGDDAFSYCDLLQYNEYDNALYLGNESNPYVVLIKAKDINITSSDIPGDTKILYNSAFSNCILLTSITIPNSVTSIGDGTFDNCTSLTSIRIPDSVTSIGKSAFYNCASLTSITIPESVTSIGDRAFYSCTSLKSINFAGTMKKWNAIMKGTGWDNNISSYTIYCIDGQISKNDTGTYN